MRFPLEWGEKAKTLQLSADTAEEWARVYRQLVAYELERELSARDGEVDKLLACGSAELLEDGWQGMTPWDVSAESPLLCPYWRWKKEESHKKAVEYLYFGPEVRVEIMLKVVSPILGGLSNNVTHLRLSREDDPAYGAFARRLLNLAEALEIELAERKERIQNPDWPRRDLEDPVF
jgi:hypothetical protein